ncbi:motile sperm domain-containing protein 2-like [Oppia nitens]|uniref:motile sperm domain-containing protein 2-like n=1 Tax=Oppia nitens TaxID=1686743 RepID=UPI0023DB869E|nr:motile sperm domain-containing protein 2-like [Oppia nitens]
MPVQTNADITAGLVQVLRGKFLAEFAITHDEFDSRDIDNIRNSDVIIRRYLEYKNGSIEESLKMLTTAMKWRKSFGVNDLKECSFPREYYQTGGLFTYGTDLNGARLIIFRVMCNKKITVWTEQLKKFIVYLIENESIKIANNECPGVCIVFDCNGAGISNVDTDLLSFIVHSFQDYYPMVLQSVIIHELPFLLNYVFKLVLSWLPKDHREVFHSVKKDDINQYIASDQLPDFMDGTNEMPYKLYPKSALTAHELAPQIGINDKDVEKLIQHVQQFIDK